MPIMKFTPGKINFFLLLKMPSAFFTGVRLQSIDDQKSVVKVTHRWINQNPFKSLFWAIQGIASELSTGILVMREITESGQKISMLVTKMNATFTKKATGKILFICKEGDKIKRVVNETIKTGEGQTIKMTSEGFNEEGISVSKFEYEWSIKLKN